MTDGKATYKKKKAHFTGLFPYKNIWKRVWVSAWASPQAVTGLKLLTLFGTSFGQTLQRLYVRVVAIDLC
jgi:hypothetical protein